MWADQDAGAADYVETLGWDAAGPPVPWDTEGLPGGMPGVPSMGDIQAATRALKGIPTAGWGTPHPSDGGFLGGVVNAVKSGLPAVAKLAAAPEMLTRTVSAAGFGALRALKSGNPGAFVQTMKAGARELTQNPLFSVAQTGASFVPGIGTAVSSGLAAAKSLGAGESLQDAALAAARGAMPGGPAAQTGFDIAVGLAKGQTMSDAAMGAVRQQLPPASRAAFDAGLAIAKRGSVDRDMVGIMRSALDAPGQKPIFDAAINAASAALSDAGSDVTGVDGAGSEIARAVLRNPELQKLSARELADRFGCSTTAARSAIAAIMRRAGVDDADYREIADIDSCGDIAQRMQVSISARPPARRKISVPKMKVTRGFLMRLHQHGGPGARHAVKKYGMLSQVARNTGELVGTTWTIRSGDFPSGVAAKVTGSAGRWKELLTANPGMTTYTDGNGATQVKPWQVGQSVNLPSSWTGATAPPATPPGGGTPVFNPPAQLPPVGGSGGSGPPFPPPSKYPNGYPAGTYTVTSADWGASKIAGDITGSSSRWKELLLLNPTHANPDPNIGFTLYAGDVLKLPISWQAVVAPPKLSPPAVWTTPPTIGGGGAPPLGSPPFVPPQVIGTQAQIALIQAMLSSFHLKHPEAGFPLAPPAFGGDVADLSGMWTSRTQAAFKSFQLWANQRGKGPLPETGFPDQASTTALAAQVNADLPAVTPPPGIKLPTNVPPVAQVPPIQVGPAQPGTPAGEEKKSDGGGALIPLLGLAAALAFG